MKIALPKDTMALVITRLIFGISNNATDEYVRSLPQYKREIKRSANELWKSFVWGVKNYEKEKEK